MSTSQHSELPAALRQDLSALGGVPAPAELWERVQIARKLEVLEPVAAPAELWQRVRADLPTPQRHLHHPIFRPIFWLAAAAVLALGILLWQPPAASKAAHSLALSAPVAESSRAAFRARAHFHQAAPAEMSDVARSLAGALGSLMVEDDA